MEVMIETCCGIDVYQKTIVCCVLDVPLETYKPSKHQLFLGTTTAELKEVLEWLDALNMMDIFMESTGQY